MHRAVHSYAKPPVDDNDTLKRFSHIVDRCARQVSARTGIAADDLWSAGALALVEAARRFDPSMSTPFEGFAVYRVRGAMLDEVRAQDRLPRRAREKMSRIESARHGLTQELGRAPSRAEVAEVAGLELSAVENAEMLAQSPASVDDTAVASDDEHIDLMLIAGETKKRVALALASLPQRSQLVLSLRFVEDLAVKEIADVLGVSEPRVSQLVKAGLEQLRMALALHTEQEARST